jgi:hypothetical protein
VPSDVIRKMVASGEAYSGGKPHHALKEIERLVNAYRKVKSCL